MVNRRVERLEQAAQRKNPARVVDEKEEWLKIQDGLIEIVDKYPEIKQDVVDMLRKLAGIDT